MKYVMFKVEAKNMPERFVPIIFPEGLVHKDVAARVARAVCDGYNAIRATPVAAGFVQLDAVVCHGESETLGLQSMLLTDGRVIEQHDYLHGIGTDYVYGRGPQL